MKLTKRIYIFGYKFVITSEPIGKDGGWAVTVSLGAIKEEYVDRIDNRGSAEEACFGYFLIEHCQGGIYWQKPDEEEQERLLAEKMNPAYCLYE